MKNLYLDWSSVVGGYRDLMISSLMIQIYYAFQVQGKQLSVNYIISKR